LNSNENPTGPGPAARAALGSALVQAPLYPDAAADALRVAVARAHGVPTASVCLGCGSTDVLRAAVQAYATPGRPLVTASPSYESPVFEAERVGAAVRAVPLGADLRLDLAAMATAAPGAGLVYVCNPNNPTATVHGREAVYGFVTRLRRQDDPPVVLVDEAYHDYVDDPGYDSVLPLAVETPGVIVARTFSKAHGLAGLRVGYAIGHPTTIEAITRHTLHIGVNGLGASAAMASLQAPGHVAAERARNRAAREYTLRFFRERGYTTSDAEANFLMVHLRRDVRAFREACRERGVLVGRPFPPLLSHARISIGTMAEMERAAAVFAGVLAAS
jgi:histidinol-phosphate aminotransferase